MYETFHTCAGICIFYEYIYVPFYDFIDSKALCVLRCLRFLYKSSKSSNPALLSELTEY